MERGENRPKLSPREISIVELLTEGKTNKEMAVALGISVRTVEGKRLHMMHKLNLHTTAELVRYAVRERII